MGTPVYGDFTTSSYFGGKSFAAVNWQKGGFFEMEIFSISCLISIDDAMQQDKHFIEIIFNYLLALAVHEYIPVAVVSMLC